MFICIKGSSLWCRVPSCRVNCCRDYHSHSLFQLNWKESDKKSRLNKRCFDPQTFFGRHLIETLTSPIVEMWKRDLNPNFHITGGDFLPIKEICKQKQKARGSIETSTSLDDRTVSKLDHFAFEKYNFHY